jgi:hypothetical protein
MNVAAAVLIAFQTAMQPVPVTIAQGARSAIDEPRQVVVRTSEEWGTLWSAHSTQPIPEVDFTQLVVVGVFSGFRPTAGFSVAMTKVEMKEKRAIVHFEEHGPPPDALVAQVVTAPYHLATLPRDIAVFEFVQDQPDRR